MSENHVIAWTSDYSLKWSDFKAELNPAVFEDSHSAIKYGFTWTVNSDKVNDEVVFLIDSIKTVTEFHPLLSWVRESESNDDLLKHEQGHFDLAEMLRRDHNVVFENKFYHKVFETRGQNDAQRKQFAKLDSGKMISNELDKLSLILAKNRKEYDAETEYGQNIPNQLKFTNIFKNLQP
tara:strand:- start:238 stop:774 length:537 start_codon:yes stop_codon:yes gene_type:complete